MAARSSFCLGGSGKQASTYEGYARGYARYIYMCRTNKSGRVCAGVCARYRPGRRSGIIAGSRSNVASNPKVSKSFFDSCFDRQAPSKRARSAPSGSDASIFEHSRASETLEPCGGRRVKSSARDTCDDGDDFLLAIISQSIYTVSGECSRDAHSATDAALQATPHQNSPDVID